MCRAAAALWSQFQASCLRESFSWGTDRPQREAQERLELKAGAFAQQRTVEAKRKSGDGRSDMQLLEEDCKERSVYETQQASSIWLGVGTGFLGQQ